MDAGAVGCLYGTLEHFDPNGTTTFTRYVDRAKLFFRANGIDDADRQHDIFLTLVGATVFDRLVDLLTPRSPAEVPLQDIITSLKAHYDPPPSKRVQRYHFYKRTRGVAESISEYVAELRIPSLALNSRICCECMVGHLRYMMISSVLLADKLN